ncbi:type 1 fimbrial protein [Limnobaculum parvum]|uniref:Type 1 fimbrial protein n=1 Tax=Limnobaculum parvum TaxID=2172103 RepID=A0A2Y9U2F8_9GAMM|nr:type 1 fimbrial protein [Limnobaculum parvum]AWH89849.1 type 1 fimbrial protein [Limnobaculum parvum]
MKYQHWFLAKAGWLLIAWTASLSMVSANESGRIIFTGTVVEGGCQLSSNQSEVVQSCIRDNRLVKSHLPIGKIEQSTMLVPTNGNNKMRFRWIDKSKGLGITEIEYN